MLASRRRQTFRLLAFMLVLGFAVVSVPVELPASRKAVPNNPVSSPPTMPMFIARLNGVSHRPTWKLPKAPFRPSALLREQKPSWFCPRMSAEDSHWNHADRPPPSFSSPLTPIALPPGVCRKSVLG